MDDDVRRAAIRAEAENVHEAATYASETQFEYAKTWRSIDRWIGSLAAALAAVSGVGGLAKLLSFSWAGGIAVASALVGAIAATLAARQTTEKAGVAANALRALQQDARIFLQIDLEVMAIEDARTTLQSLVDRQQQLSREAVIPSTRAWNRAKKQIEGEYSGVSVHPFRGFRTPPGARGRRQPSCRRGALSSPPSGGRRVDWGEFCPRMPQSANPQVKADQRCWSAPLDEPSPSSGLGPAWRAPRSLVGLRLRPRPPVCWRGASSAIPARRRR